MKNTLRKSINQFHCSFYSTSTAHNLFKKWLLIFVFLTGSFSSFSQSSKPDEMNVDLPDETEETDLVEKNQLQIETGFLYNSYQQDKASFIGQGLIRYGILKRLEGRLLIEDGSGRDRYISTTVQSTYPLAASAKLSLIKDVKGLPDATFVTYLKLPFTSHTKEQARYWSPLFLLAFQNKLGDKWKLEYNGGIRQEAFSINWTWMVNASLHYKIIEPLELFGEYYAQYGKNNLPQHNLGGGVAYQIGKKVEVFVAAGSSIYEQPSNYFLVSGFAVRFPE